MKRLEYGFARAFVAQKKDYIQQELEKLRTIKSIWNELKDQSKEKISYRVFAYQLSNQITKNLPLQYYLGAENAKKENQVKSKDIVKSFEFTPQVNSEDIV